jgi:hypothetical protein
MNKNLKKIIAREGLIFLSIILLGTILFIWVWVTKPLYMSIGELWRNDVLIVCAIFYIPYLLIRFITWAINTLREK